MKLVIDIDEDYYEIVKHEVEANGGHFLPFALIAKGTPLPKGHGDLKDADRLLDSFYEYCKNGDFGYHQAEDLIKSSPTIIESDKSEV